VKKALIIIVVLAIVYLLGPAPDTPKYDTVLPYAAGIEHIERTVDSTEMAFQVKPGNRAGIVWHDPTTKAKTDVVLLYLHGFTASHQEGYPMHLNFAERYGSNLYLARLSEHGLLTDEPLLHYTPDGVWESAKEALSVAKILGDKVVIMSTSTGGTLALRLAATYPEIAGIINYSPNIEINDPAAFLLNDPWGLQISRLFFGGKYREVDSDEDYRKFWYDRYRLEGVVALQELVETTCTPELFEKITCPVFNGVYYKDEKNQDEVVRVSAVERMHELLSTPEDQKVLRKFPEAQTHVIANKERSRSFEAVRDATFEFADEVLKLQPRSQNQGKVSNLP